MRKTFNLNDQMFDDAVRTVMSVSPDDPKPEALHSLDNILRNKRFQRYSNDMLRKMAMIDIGYALVDPAYFATVLAGAFLLGVQTGRTQAEVDLMNDQFGPKP